MRLLYIFMTTVVVLFYSRCLLASSIDLNPNTLSQVKTALWIEGFRLGERPQKEDVPNQKKVQIEKPAPEELTRAMELERKKLYKIL